MKIAIRADGGSKIGMGHIMRTLVLAKELAKSNEIFYICKIDNSITYKYKAGIEKVKNTGFEVKLVNEDNLIEELKNIEADMLITDSYDVNEIYFDKTKEIFEITGYIDDISDITYKLLNCLKLLDYNFHVIVGNGFVKVDNLMELEEQNSNIKLYFNANMLEVMKKCDVAISACGSTLYELSVCKIPTIGILVADNQIKIANTMANLGMIINLGWYSSITGDKLLNNLNNLCKDFNLRNKLIKNNNMVDREGVVSLAKKINDLSKNMI